MRGKLSVAALVIAAGCSSEATWGDGRNATGSRALISSSDFRALYVANADEDTIARVELDGLTVGEISVPGEPTRIARAGARVIATLRASRKVAVFEENEGTLVPAGEVDTGAEPYGIVAHPHLQFFYVASSLSGLVEEFDGRTLVKTRVWEVPGEPRWLAIHPSGASLYVASAFDAGLHVIDLPSGRSAPIYLWAQFFRFDTMPRFTGDLAVSPNGSALAVPVLFVDHRTPIDDSAPEPSASEQAGYAGERINPVVATIPLDELGRPSGEPKVMLLDSAEGASYASSVAFSPDSRLVVAALEGSSKAAIFDLAYPFPFPVSIAVGAGPRSVAFTENETAWVYSFLDRLVSRIDVRPDLATFPATIQTQPGTSLAVAVASSNLSPEVERGRRLFYSTDDPKLSRPGGELSCATCHLDGRTDGLTWAFVRGPRQTPSLAGGISARAPLRWSGDRESVAVDAKLTAQNLMGGRGLSEADAQDIQLFADSIRDVDLPLKGASDPEIELGRAIFERADVGCSSCHSGVLYTDHALHDLLGFDGVRTPSLIGVAATPPYFHDGSAATLRDVVLRARSGAMGNTGVLSDAEISALARFLSTL